MKTAEPLVFKALFIDLVDQGLRLMKAHSSQGLVRLLGLVSVAFLDFFAPHMYWLLQTYKTDGGEGFLVSRFSQS